jgi:hypothetical protein
MKVLVACEYSGRVRDAFRALGHDAWSCDILPTEADPTFHIQGPVQCVLHLKWDLMIAHGLRKAGATIAADEGATAHELMAMFGWSRLSMAEIYTKEADKKKLARAASERLSNRM